METVKAPFDGTISKSDDGRYVFVTSNKNDISVTYDKLKLTTTNKFVSKGGSIGEKEPGFVEKYYKKSGNTWVPDSGTKPDKTNTSDKDAQSISDKEFANRVIGGAIGIGLPGLAIARNIATSSMKESTDNQSDILSEELKKMRKLINF